MNTNNNNCCVSNEDIIKFFQITFKYSDSNNIKMYLFVDCKFTNCELIQSILITKKEWVYHYYIPFFNNSTLEFSNFLIVGLLTDNDLLEFFKLLNFSFCINDKNQILNTIDSIDWNILNLYDHSCKWSNQEFFSDLLYFISCGDINLIPPHWYMPNNSYKFFNFKNL